jgi:hypothetical protein
VYLDMSLTYDPSLFEVDGSLRDICVLNASRDDWSRVVSRLFEAQRETQFTTTLDYTPDVRTDAGKLLDTLESHPEANATFSVRFGSIWFTCYFFEASEIEFTFDPADVVDASSFHDVAAFMSEVGMACGKSVIMTMESNDHHHHIPALLEWAPSTGTPFST